MSDRVFEERAPGDDRFSFVESAGFYKYELMEQIDCEGLPGVIIGIDLCGYESIRVRGILGTVDDSGKITGLSCDVIGHDWRDHQYESPLWRFRRCVNCKKVEEL